VLFVRPPKSAAYSWRSRLSSTPRRGEASVRLAEEANLVTLYKVLGGGV